ncbi:TonB-dependent receptor [Piscinibacter koreensis]|uniref:TonB-dependent siderophore receptor n=1 Tax=Piscinibacter koreensis TaxID=2742824 RepID=A0A7Y6NJW5_9BURK|nr:TonB-dependent siderophore receptor [Schlegelella koreensis]NUZ04464.1 TonB-dependent siderophore receptor [Schlegelella koreensis]
MNEGSTVLAHDLDPSTTSARAAATPRLLPLGALAAGFGLFSAPAPAQTAPAAPSVAASAPAAPAAAASQAAGGTTLGTISVKARAETDQNSVRATTSTIGRGNQELRDIPQSVTVVTEKLMEDRRVDTVKEALHYTAGISFLAAEGGEEDIRLRGFSLTSSGDIYIDSVRDPAFYERDVFNFDRIELLRGSASMLFGRGSTGGVVNQVSKQPLLTNINEVSTTIGNGGYLRSTGDFNIKTSETSAFRVNAMVNTADNYGNKIDKYGIAPTFRWGINTDDEFSIGLYHLRNDNGINYGLPWLRRDASGPISATNPAGLIDISPRNYYGAKSDYNAGEATYGTLHYTHRFGDGGAWHTVLRHGEYKRDMRASTIRFCTRGTGNPVTNPDCPAVAPTQSTLDGSQPLTRGTNNKVQNLKTTYLQTDYTNKFEWFGRQNDIIAGIDYAREEFENFTMSVPAGVVLDKNTPRVTIGSPNDGTSVDESRRIRTLNRSFVAKALGVYAQDMIAITPEWKVLGGLRWDRFEGNYVSPTSTTFPEASRSDSLLSKRFGVLYQPNDTSSFYASYGTSFNTSGELYNYDAPGSNAPPEKSRNIEVGAKVDFFDGRLSTRAAVFHSTKYNERNRDSPEGEPLVDYLLSGKRHATGLELDLAGRITPAWEVFVSYAWIPRAKIDKAAFGVTPGGEREGDRPSLTPRHSGSLFTTYQLTPDWRIGGGLNARSKQTPNRNPAGIVAPGYVTGDLMVEYTFSPQIALKLNVINVTNKLYADSIYSGHYVPGQARTVYATMTARF